MSEQMFVLPCNATVSKLYRGAAYFVVRLEQTSSEQMRLLPHHCLPYSLVGNSKQSLNKCSFVLAHAPHSYTCKTVSITLPREIAKQCNQDEFSATDPVPWSFSHPGRAAIRTHNICRGIGRPSWRNRWWDLWRGWSHEDAFRLEHPTVQVS